jgi:hypothetical protein
MLGCEPIRKRKNPDLIDLRIASPCSAEWSKMTGTDRVRHCSECNLKVYNFSAMTSDEIEDLVSSRGGRLYARIYRRSDGTMLTEDCPVGVRARVVRRVSRVAGMAVAALMSISAAAWQKVQPKECSPSAQVARHDSGLEVTVVDPQEALVPGAQVVMVRKDARKKKKGVTNGEGRLQLQNLKAGDYSLAVRAKGFRAANSAVILSEGKVLEVKVKLQVREVASETVVVAEAPLVMGTTICINPVTPSSIPPAMGASRGAVSLRQ